jgi:hypothetical protein
MRLTMMTTLATATALLAVLSGVLLAALDRPHAAADRRTEHMSLALVIAASMTAAAGVAYAIMT